MQVGGFQAADSRAIFSVGAFVMEVPFVYLDADLTVRLAERPMASSR